MPNLGIGRVRNTQVPRALARELLRNGGIELAVTKTRVDLANGIHREKIVGLFNLAKGKHSSALFSC
jgi:hypothetical protein